MFIKKANTTEGHISTEDIRTNFEYEIRYLKKYFDLNTISVQRHKEELETSLLNEIELEPSKESLLIEFYQKEIQLITSYYYHSSIVLIYTVLENILTQICTQIQIETNNKFSVNLLGSRNNIEKTKDYLELTTKLEFRIIEGIWPRIGQFQKLRNIIVHQNSTFKDAIEMRKLRNMFSEILISNDNKSFYIPDNKLTDEFILKIEALVNVILGDIESKLFEINPRENNNQIENLPF